MRQLLLSLTALFLMGAVSAAQCDAPKTDPAPEKKQEDSKDKKDKKKDKKDKKDKKSGSGDAIDTSAVFSERIANDVLNQIRDGLEGHSLRTMLSAFDGDKMDGFLSFEDQIESYFRRYNAFRVHFRVAQVAVDGTRGIVLVDAEIEQTPAASGPPVRKRSQLRFEIEQGRKGWKVVDMRDRGFFS